MGSVSVGYRVVERNPGHTTVSVFSGRQEGSRGHSGTLVFRTDEWDELPCDSEGRVVLRLGRID